MSDKYQKLAAGTHCEVTISPKALRDLKKAPTKDKARAFQILNHLSEQGPDDLNNTQFKSEGRKKRGDGSSVMMVYAVKAYQVRIYGGWVKGSPLEFRCPEATIKKNQKADQEQLKRVASKLGD